MVYSVLCPLAVLCTPPACYYCLPSQQQLLLSIFWRGELSPLSCLCTVLTFYFSISSIYYTTLRCSFTFNCMSTLYAVLTECTNRLTKVNINIQHLKNDDLCSLSTVSSNIRNRTCINPFTTQKHLLCLGCFDSNLLISRSPLYRYLSCVHFRYMNTMLPRSMAKTSLRLISS